MTTKTLFAGFGGQGVLLMGYILALTGMNSGKEVTYLPSYGAEVRGGTANCTVVISDEPIASPVASSPDVGVMMNEPSLTRFAASIEPGGYLLLNSSLITAGAGRDDVQVVTVAANELAHQMGEDRSANVVMLGALCQATGVVSLEDMKLALAETGLGKKPRVLEINRRALDVGAAEAAKALAQEKRA